MKVKSESEVAQLCPTLSDLMDCSPPGSSMHWIFQAKVLEWGAIASPPGSLGEGLSRVFSNTTVQKYQLFSAQLSFGEGNDTPLQYSCLENPMEGGAW